MKTRLVSFTNDMAPLISANSIDIAQLRLNMVMDRVKVWIRDSGLSRALSNTEIVIIIKRTFFLGEEVFYRKIA